MFMDKAAAGLLLIVSVAALAMQNTAPQDTELVGCPRVTLSIKDTSL